MPESPKRNWTTAYPQNWLGKVSTKFHTGKTEPVSYKLRITFPEKKKKNPRFKCVILLNQNESDNYQWPNWMTILKPTAVMKALSRVTRMHIKSMSSGLRQIWVPVLVLSSMTLDLNSLSPFCYLQIKDRTGLLWELKDILYIKNLIHCLAHSKWSVLAITCNFRSFCYCMENRLMK